MKNEKAIISLDRYESMRQELIISKAKAERDRQHIEILGNSLTSLALQFKLREEAEKEGNIEDSMKTPVESMLTNMNLSLKYNSELPALGEGKFIISTVKTIEKTKGEEVPKQEAVSDNHKEEGPE